MRDLALSDRLSPLQAAGLSQRQLGSIGAVDREPSVDTPGDVVELDIHFANPILVGDLEDVDAVDGELSAANAGECKVPDDLVAAGEDLLGVDAGDGGSEENALDVLCLAREGVGAGLEDNQISPDDFRCAIQFDILDGLQAC